MFGRILSLSIVLLLIPSTALAEPSPLRLAEVLESVAVTHPKIAEAQAFIRAQRGRRLAATALNEPKVGVSASANPYGYYDYWQFATTVEQRIPTTGVKLLGGYRLGQGDIPLYYGERETRDGGELFAKLAVPLLADRAIDKERAEVEKARIAAEGAGFAQETTWLELARKASLDYWEWVAAGQKLLVAEELLRIATERVGRINKQAASGAYARIAIVDAQKVLLSRQSKLLQAKGKFASAQQKLALQFRAADGIPQTVPLARVPGDIRLPKAIAPSKIESWIQSAIAMRPELKQADNQKRQARIDRALAKNKALPTLDANAFVARDLGDGSATLGQTDVGIGLTFSVPLFRREGRGLQEQAEAKLAIIEAKQRGLRDQIAASIRQSAQLAQLAAQRTVVAESRLTATEQLADAERERILQGASDLLTLNLRELDVASAANEVIESKLAAHRATIELIYSRGMISSE
jgi:cobalt-zinc-cadmium efflux system outer membrane protein